MNIWECLGIEKTKDLNRIKSSYAKLLRSHHPEDDPEGFQILKTAYDFAQRFAGIKEDEDAGKEELLLEIGFNHYCRQNMRNTDNGDDRYGSKGSAFDSDASGTDIPQTPPAEQRMIPRAVYGGAGESDANWIEEFLKKLDTLYNDFSLRCQAASWENLLKEDLFCYL